MFDAGYLTAGVEDVNNRVFTGNGWDSQAKRSVNAVKAEEEGKFPDYEWHGMPKQKILEFINSKIELLGGPKAISFDVKLLKKAQKKALLQLFLEQRTTEYHHVDIWEKGRLWRHQAVGYFGISKAKLITVTDEEIISLISTIRAENLVEKNMRKARMEVEQELRFAKPLMIGLSAKYFYC